MRSIVSDEKEISRKIDNGTYNWGKIRWVTDMNMEHLEITVSVKSR